MNWFKDRFTLTSPQPEQRSTEWGTGRVVGAPNEPREDFAADSRAEVSTPKQAKR